MAQDSLKIRKEKHIMVNGETIKEMVKGIANFQMERNMKEDGKTMSLLGEQMNIGLLEKYVAKGHKMKNNPQIFSSLMKITFTKRK